VFAGGPGGGDAGENGVRETLRALPGAGAPGYGVLRYLHPELGGRAGGVSPEPLIGFQLTWAVSTPTPEGDWSLDRRGVLRRQR